MRFIPFKRNFTTDRHLKLGAKYSHVTQRFRKPTYRILNLLEDRLCDFNKYVLFFKKNTDYPSGILKAFNDFMSERNLDAKVLSEYTSGSIEKGTVYFTINDNDLWEIIKDCKQDQIEIGEDVGILSHNNNTVKEIISGGITTFSTDFREMAKKAADYIKIPTLINEIIPTTLVRRNSL